MSRPARMIASVAIIFYCLMSVAMKATDSTVKQMSLFADTFIDSLDESQRADLLLPYDSDQRTRWHFIPRPNRRGLSLDRLDSAQSVAALRLVRASLSEMGYHKARRVMMLESVLRIVEGERPRRKWQRDPNRYYLTLFGAPGETNHWGMSFEGHHLSLNLVCRDGKVVDSTPQFFGTSPAQIMTEIKSLEGLPVLTEGTRVLREEEVYAFKLIGSLDAQQLSQVVIAEQAPREIRFAGKPQPIAETQQPSPTLESEDQGIAFGSLKPTQQAMLKKLADVYLSAAAPEIAKSRRSRIDGNGWENVRFAWAGATKPGIGHYYRIEGSEFLIELVNTQPDALGNPANHIHCVLRDLSGDFDLPAS